MKASWILEGLSVIYLPYLYLLSYLSQEFRTYGFQTVYQHLLPFLYALQNVAEIKEYRVEVREYLRVRGNIMVLNLPLQDHHPYLSAEVFFGLYYLDLEVRRLRLREHHRQQIHRQWKH